MDLLCSRDDVKLYLNITNTAADPALDALITAVSAYALNQANMPDREDGDDPTFFEEDYLEHYDGHGGQVLLLRHSAPTTPVTLVSSVVVNGLSIPRAGEAPGRGYVWTSKAVQLRGYYFTKGARNITVRYTAGFDADSATGQALKGAAVEWVALVYKTKAHIDVKAKTLDHETVSFIAEAMPVRMAQVLTNLKVRMAA